jgi:hypothetical protein
MRLISTTNSGEDEVKERYTHRERLRRKQNKRLSLTATQPRTDKYVNPRSRGMANTAVMVDREVTKRVPPTLSLMTSELEGVAGGAAGAGSCDCARSSFTAACGVVKAQRKATEREERRGEREREMGHWGLKRKAARRQNRVAAKHRQRGRGSVERRAGGTEKVHRHSRHTSALTRILSHSLTLFHIRTPFPSMFTLSLSIHAHSHTHEHAQSHYTAHSTLPKQSM